MAQIGRSKGKSRALGLAGLAGAAALGAALSFGYTAYTGEELARMEPQAESEGEIPDQEISVSEEPAAAESAPQRVLVHIDGEVAEPGVYALKAGDVRVADIVDLAGGLTEEADTATVNLAAPVQDGQKVHIPSEDEAASQTGVVGVSGPQTGSEGLIDLNNASPEQLMELPGVGEATAAAIIRDREQYGPFASVEDLMRVSGIGERKLERMRDLIYV